MESLDKLAKKCQNIKEDIFKERGQMNKKIFGAVCALSLAFNFVVLPMADAAIKVPHAKTQETWAMDQMSRKGLSEGTSYEARQLSNILNNIAYRICDYSGLSIENHPFQNDNDYKTKIHPIHVSEGSTNAHSLGSGHIFVGVKHIKNHIHLENFEHASLSQYDHFALEMTMAHEMSHSILGHAYETGSKEKYEDRYELEAEQRGVALINDLPEGGWGLYMSARARLLNRPDQNEAVIQSFGKKTNGKITFKVVRGCGSGEDHFARLISTYYNASDGHQYEILGANASGNNGWRRAEAREGNAYFGGQLAQCIAEGALTLDNLRVATLGDGMSDINMGGDCLLICRSPKLPNGYRVLFNLNGNPQQMLKMLKHAKANVSQNTLTATQNRRIARMETMGGNWHGDDLKPYSEEHMRLVIEEAVAVAYDCANR